MGTWGVLAFDNDDAVDWVYSLETVDDLSLIESAFVAVEASEDYLEAPEATQALAACEVLARLRGQPGYTNAYTEAVDAWVATHIIDPPVILFERAGAVINRIVAGESELYELWEDSESLDEWLAALNDLRQRLQSG